MGKILLAHEILIGQKHFILVGQHGFPRFDDGLTGHDIHQHRFGSVLDLPALGFVQLRVVLQIRLQGLAHYARKGDVQVLSDIKIGKVPLQSAEGHFLALDVQSPRLSAFLLNVDEIEAFQVPAQHVDIGIVNSSTQYAAHRNQGLVHQPPPVLCLSAGQKHHHVFHVETQRGIFFKIQGKFLHPVEEGPFLESFHLDLEVIQPFNQIPHVVPKRFKWRHVHPVNRWDLLFFQFDLAASLQLTGVGKVGLRHYPQPGHLVGQDLNTGRGHTGEGQQYG